MDYGHSIYGGESPAEVVCMLEDSDYDYYIHINDNDRTWDWDYFCGSHTFLEYVEFIYYLKKFSYDKFLTSDSHPTRWDMKEMFTINARVTTKIWDLLDRVGMKEITKYVDTENYLPTWKFVEENILGLK
jgi:xylose isomerase